MSGHLYSWFEVDCTTGSGTVTFTDDMAILEIRLRGYAARGLNGTWPSTAKIAFKGRNNMYFGQSVQADVNQSAKVGIVLPIADTTAARWFDGVHPPLVRNSDRLSKTAAVATRQLTVEVYETDSSTVLTGDDIKLFFEVVHVA